jgi:hypothetical protein
LTVDRAVGGFEWDEKKKSPRFHRVFFKEREFKVFGSTVNQAGFSGICGCYRVIGYIKYSFVV